MVRRPLLAVSLLLAGIGSPGAQQGPLGLTRPVILPPFDSSRPPCTAPPNLDKVLAFAQDNERKFMQGVARGLELAARDRGLAYRIAQAGNDACKMIEQIEAFR